MGSSRWTVREEKTLLSLSTPAKIQSFVDGLTYNLDTIVRSPRGVLRAKRAHCFDGAIFAAAALEFHGISSSLVALYATENDDDHVVTVFRRSGYWGAIAKSNYVPLRWRDPVYKSLRELAISYFDGYFLLNGQKTLRAYSRPFDICKVRDVDWRTSDKDLDPLGTRIDDKGRISLLAPWMTESWINKEIKPADNRWIKAAAVGLDPRGVFKG